MLEDYNHLIEPAWWDWKVVQGLIDQVKEISLNTEEAMPTVIVLITLRPTNIVIIFVRLILMWNNNDEDYDHVDAGNQERDELGKEVFNTDTGSNFC